MAVIDQERILFLTFPGSKAGLSFLKMDDGHSFAMVGGEGHTGKCIGGQVMNLAKRRGRLGRKKSGKKRSEESEVDDSDTSFTKRNSVPAKEKECEACSCRPGQDHLGGHRAPSRAEIEEMMFQWACRLLASKFPVNYSPTKIISDVYKKWPFEPRRKLSQYTELLKEKLAAFQKAAVENQDNTAIDFIRSFGSPVFRKFMDHLTTAPIYWGPPKLRSK